MNTISTFALNADIKTVQEPAVHKFTFDMKSIIPGSSPGGIDSGIVPAIHIYFPTTLIKDPKNSASNPINIIGKTTTVSLVGSPTF
jgi:hypothetical protein